MQPCCRRAVFIEGVGGSDGGDGEGGEVEDVGEEPGEEDGGGVGGPFAAGEAPKGGLKGKRVRERWKRKGKGKVGCT